MSDLIERLRHAAFVRFHDGWESYTLAADAATRIETLERKVEELRAAVIEECATVAENWRRKKTGRDLSKASFDPCGRWEGGEIYEEGKERVLIAAAIRRIKPSEAEGRE